MKKLESLIFDIIALPHKKRDREHLLKMKRQWAKKYGEKNVPTNISLFKTYQSLLSQKRILEDKEIENLLKKRSIRSLSGIVAVQVLTKPFRCPGECIFCPNDASMPKSYINTQPGAMRALLNHFDPYKQVYNRLLSLKLTGHNTDKIEMIVLGGTRDVYPKQYKIDFIKGLYDACNTFTEFLQKINIDYTNPKSARYTQTEDLDIVYPETLEESIKINENANKRIIGLTIETRPEYVTDENCQFWRSLGVTRMEMGVQTLHNDVHEANKRGHDNEAIRKAMHKLRQYGFKISNHYMPGLYQSNFEKDLETFKMAFSSPWIKPDEMKFYPTAVIPNTQLYELRKKQKYQPMNEQNLITLIERFKKEIAPPYMRIKRLARDFDTNEVVAGANTPNLRQITMKKMQQEMDNDVKKRREQYKRLGESLDFSAKSGDIKTILKCLKKPLGVQTKKYTSLSGEERDRDDRMETYCVDGIFDIVSQRNFVCLCTRCREMRNRKELRTKIGDPRSKEKSGSIDECRDESGIHPHQKKLDLPFLVIRRYRSSVGEEIFVSFEDFLGYLYGFARLLLPDYEHTLKYEGLGKNTALIRELHVYGSLASLSGEEKSKKNTKIALNKVQHKGFGIQLMEIAETIAQIRNYKKMSVIAGVGVRKYYERKLGYKLEGTYMVKNLVRV